MSKEERQPWNIERARKFYNIPIWSEGYFDINELGHMVACPGNQIEIDLTEVNEELCHRGISLPVLIRFPQILQARIEELSVVFDKAASTHNFNIEHIPFYPIKVNQQRTVLEHVLSSDVPNVGLEVGSKTELLAALGLIDSTNGLLICNGYKDRTYIRIALYAHMMGIQTFIVIENLSEITLIQHECTELGIEPLLGVRVRLNSVASGNWQNSGGRNAKFGLRTEQLLKLIEILKLSSCAHWLKVLHFHMGSQISDLNDISTGLQEALCIYNELCMQGFSVESIDVGGGLAVDYSSQQDASYFSKAYSIKDYANAIVKTTGDFCRDNNLLFPKIFTENGRALTAHHAVLITNVVDEDNNQNEEPNKNSIVCDLHQEITGLIENEQILSEQQAEHYQNQINQKFLSAEINLRQRADLEQLLYRRLSTDLTVSSALTKYYCNFSLFQSMPDTWGLEQIFPIVPLARLNEEPTVDARIHDLTCDSDGQVPIYACDSQLKQSLQLHELSNEEQYLLGFFMLGAYQEILGDIHNLFGDTHTVNVEKQANGELIFTDFEVGDCVNELLSKVHIEFDQVLSKCEEKLKNAGAISEVKNNVLNEIKNALFGYTYLDSMNRPAHRIKD